MGGTTDFAQAPTPALAVSYLLDFSQDVLTWQEEQMSAARVMPDAVLLPDGTVVRAAACLAFPLCVERQLWAWSRALHAALCTRAACCTCGMLPAVPRGRWSAAACQPDVCA